jgi:acetyltransferase-like isoleucine patch superfamily enzyme
MKRLLRKWIRSHEAAYQFYRSALMLYRRRRYRLVHVSKTFFMHRPVVVHTDLRAGEYSFVSFNAYLGPLVSIGNYTILAPEVTVAGGDHRIDLPGVPIYFSGRERIRPTVIEDDVWVGQRVLIKAGVRVGRGSIIAMGSVVTKDVEPYSIMAGVPARLIKRRFSEAEARIHDEMLQGPIFKGSYCGDFETSSEDPPLS